MYFSVHIALLVHIRGKGLCKGVIEVIRDNAFTAFVGLAENIHDSNIYHSIHT